jgi:hypothetical protein
MERVRKKPAQSDISAWARIGGASFRKPCAWMTLFFIFGIVMYSLKYFGDVPSGVTDVLKWLVAIPVGVVGSSSWEHKIDTQNRHDFEEEGNSYDEGA